VGSFEVWPKTLSTPAGMLDWSRDQHLGNRDNFGPYTLKPGEYWMMGDNRDNSSDSRYFGPVPLENLRGTPLIRYWPLDRAGFLK
jgi:signal peptidase I